MSDDRFENGNPYRTPKGEREWDGITLEEALRAAIARGEEKEIAPLFRMLPDDKREKYREIWKEQRKKREGGVT